MEKHFQIFLQIWNQYNYALPLQCPEYDHAKKIIDKIEQQNYHFLDDKIFLQGIVSDLSRIVYYYKYDDRFGYDYDEDNPYIVDQELNSCFQIRLYLQSLL